MTDQKIIEEQLEIIINDFFVEKLFNNKQNKNKLELHEYLRERIDHLENILNIKFDSESIKESFILVCNKLGILNKVSSDINLSADLLIDIIDNKVSFDKDACSLISKNIINSYQNTEIDLDQLYKHIPLENAYEKIKNLIHKDVYDYISVNKQWQKKEAIGCINTFLETTNYSKKEIDALIKLAKKINPDEFEFEFFSHIANEINQKSLVSEPFSINENTIEYKSKTSGIYDYFMYCEKNKTFALNFSTNSTGTEIDGQSIFIHSLSFLSIIHQYSISQIKNKDKMETVLNNILKPFSVYESAETFKQFLLDNSTKNHNEINFETKDNFYRNMNKNLNHLLADSFKNISKEFLTYKDPYLSSDPQIVKSYTENKSNSVPSVFIDDDFLKRIFDSLEFKFKIFYFGEVSSKKNRYTYSSFYTDEEIKAGLNILAFTGKNFSGLGCVKLSPLASLSLIEQMNFRFNTDTKRNKQCLNIEKLNSNIRGIGKIIIEKFMLNEDPLTLVQKTYTTESKQLLENIALFEKNVLSQILDLIDRKNISTNEAYLKTMNEFNISPKISFEQFIECLQVKFDILMDEKIDQGNTLLLKNLKLIIDKEKNMIVQNEKVSLLENKLIQQIKNLLDKGFMTPVDIISDQDYPTELLIKIFGKEEVFQHRTKEDKLIENDSNFKQNF